MGSFSEKNNLITQLKGIRWDDVGNWNIGKYGQDWNVVVTVIYDASTTIPEEAASPSSSQHVLRLQGDYVKLFDEGRHTDVVFEVAGEEVSAHKAVLISRCAYFERMFETEMTESSSNVVKVTDVRPVVFKALLKYLYSGVEPDYSSENTMDLLAAADKYGVEDLKGICEALLRRQVDSDNVIEMLVFADIHGCPLLMERATGIFKFRVLDLMKEKERWKKLKASSELLLKLLEICCED